MKLNNSIERGRPAVITHGRIAHAGAVTYGAVTGLQHYPAAKIAEKLFPLAGDPETPEIPSAMAKYADQLVVVKDAYAAQREALDAGRKYCRLAINLLKPVLGDKWNTAWQSAGFHLPTLAVPKQPSAMLTAFRGYFGTHPTHENAAANITSARAEELATAIDNAIVNVGNERDLRIELKADRDELFAGLRRTLSGLRAELAELLAPDDGRWYDFGFRRPVDGKVPTPVTDLVLTPGGAGIVLASWTASSYATNYRVRWRNIGSGAEWVEMGLFTEPQCALSGLPSGTEIAVAVSARNDSGETAATEALILVP